MEGRGLKGGMCGTEKVKFLPKLVLGRIFF